MLALIALILCAICAFVYMTEDRKGPVISYPIDKEILYTEGESESVLLADVQAVDGREGDVTDSLRIGEINLTADGTQAVVLYTAKDSSNNVTRKSRVIDYREQDVQEGAEPEGEGAAAPQETPVPTPEPPAAPSSEEQAAKANEDLIAALDPAAPRVYLTQYTVTIPAGSEFQERTYVREIQDDADAQEALMDALQVNGELDVNTPGVYEKHYFVVDSSGQQSNLATLTVTVQ